MVGSAHPTATGNGESRKRAVREPPPYRTFAGKAPVAGTEARVPLAGSLRYQNTGETPMLPEHRRDACATIQARRLCY